MNNARRSGGLSASNAATVRRTKAKASKGHACANFLTLGISCHSRHWRDTNDARFQRPQKWRKESDRKPSRRFRRVHMYQRGSDLPASELPKTSVFLEL